MTEGAESLPVLPLKGSALFPNLLMPLSVGRPFSVAAVEAALASEEKTLILACQVDPKQEEPTLSDLAPIATRAVIKRMDRTDAGLQVLVQGVDRVRLVEAQQERPFLLARFHRLPAPADSGTEVEALHGAVVDRARKVVALISPQGRMALDQALAQLEDPLDQAYLIASAVGLDRDKSIALLAANTRRQTFEQLHEWLNHELQVLELRQEITSKAETEMSRAQREHMLRQQMKAIREELGEQSGEQEDIAELRRQIEEAELPDDVRAEAERELRRMERMSAAAPDYQLTRTWLELVAELPWQKTTDDRLDLKHARTILDEDHYGLDDVKDRIIEHLAVLKLNPNAKAPILCFVGPPGVGKTSLGQSIARALGREFERLSLGGMHDEAELRGHRRTYIGAMPGRIVQAIRRAGVRNPLLMLDEVDKLGRDFRGDPAAALLEILDPAQNSTFRDNYLDMPFDLSKVFFITTANTLDTIPQPLLDRMEIIRIAGYSDAEKLQIARRYLIPRQMKEAGLSEGQLTIPDESVLRILRGWARESGVRTLERRIGTLCRKAATRIAEGETEPMTVAPDVLEDWLGPERFFEEDARKELAPGVVAGLAWTPVGGEVLYVEAMRVPGENGLLLTGQLGDVMKESAQAARSWVRSHAREFGVDEAAFRDAGVHVHVPAGATPKDGPSAGVTMATALMSLWADRPVRSDTAMTGEITLSGLVLPVGGIKEKVLAAHRAGIRRVVLPRRNEKDLRDVPENVRAELEFITVETIADVLEAAIPALQPATAGGSRTD